MRKRVKPEEATRPGEGRICAKLYFGILPRCVTVTNDFKTFTQRVRATGLYDGPLPSQQVGVYCAGNIFIDDFNDIEVAVHELTHAVDKFMEDVGISNDTEVRAILVEKLFSQYCVKVLKWKKVKREVAK